MSFPMDCKPRQAPLSMGSSRQEHWSRLSCPSPWTVAPPGSSVPGDSPGKNPGVGRHALLQGDLPDPGIERASLTSSASAGGSFTI